MFFRRGAQLLLPPAASNTYGNIWRNDEPVRGEYEMWKKIAMIAAVGLQLFVWRSGAVRAEADVRVQEPDTLRIPPAIALLAKTPFYDSPEDESDGGKPAGWLAPQDSVQVLGGEYKWARGKSWWKIQTWLGEKWISPDPWTVDIQAPPKLTLFADTPLYASQNDKQEPSAELAPQEVEVVGAEKQWFYSNDPNERKWIKIRTTWIGDQWVHLPVNRIGYVKPVDYYMYYSGYSMWSGATDRPVYAVPLLNQFAGSTTRIAATIGAGTAHITGEFVTVYDTNYQVETVNGPAYIFERGTPVDKVDEAVKLPTRTALFSVPWDGTKVIAILQPQTVKAFERMHETNTYHVHTEFGDGWINMYDAEPVDPTPANGLSIDLNGNTPLYILPSDSLPMNGASISGKTVRPVAYWQEKGGYIWYKMQTNDGIAWFHIDPNVDRIHLNDGEPLAQIVYQTTLIGTVTVDGGKLNVYGEPVGWMNGDTPYIGVRYLQGLFRYTPERADDDSSLLLRNDSGYSLRIAPGSREAVTYWNGKEVGRVQLREAPQQADDALYLSGGDVETLFGATIDWFKNRSHFYLFADEFAVDPSQPPAAATGMQLRASAYTYNRMMDYYTGQPAVAPVLNVYNRTTARAADGYTTKDNGTLNWRYRWSEQSAIAALQPGRNELTASVTVGARVLWRQNWAVTEAAGE